MKVVAEEPGWWRVDLDDIDFNVLATKLFERTRGQWSNEDVVFNTIKAYTSCPEGWVLCGYIEIIHILEQTGALEIQRNIEKPWATDRVRIINHD